MLHDLFMVELYFGPHEGVHRIEDMARNFGEEAVQAALNGGLLKSKTVCKSLSSNTARKKEILCWLSEKGRKEACKDSATLHA